MIAEPGAWKPRLIMAGAALGLAVVLGLIGYSIGLSLALWKGELIGLDQIVIASVAEPRGVERATALLFAWPAIVAGVAAIIHHIRRGPPPLRTLAFYFGIPLLALAAATVLQVLSVRSTLGDAAVQPMVSLAMLGPGGAEVKVAAFVAAVMWLYVATKRSVA